MTNNKKKYFITTPIYYANGKPHIGNAYASITADVLARYKRLLGYDVRFSTGTDENGQKMVQKAQEQWKDVMTYLNEIAEIHKQVRDNLEISYTDFVRTTEPRHEKFVQEVLTKTYENGDIYEGEYEGYYCVWCEAFKKKSDLQESDGSHGIDKGKHVCPDHPNRNIDIVKEKNWFFKLSKYQDKLEHFFADNPDFVQPDFRFNEIISFTKKWLEDFSISRENHDFGISLPFDTDSVSYIRYDALVNYMTVSHKEWFRDKDTQIVHVLGKDIARFHGIYRPAMLMSAWYRLPDQEFITGFFTVDGQKMGKSMNNTIDPEETATQYDRDAIVMYLLYDIKLGSDGDFSRTRFKEMYSSMLIGGRGNLVARVTKLSAKQSITECILDETIYRPKLTLFTNLVQHHSEHDNKLLSLFLEWRDQTIIDQYVDTWNLQPLIRDRYELVQWANKYINDAEPRIKLKDEDSKIQAIEDLQFLLHVVKNIAIIGAPLMINSFRKIQTMYNNTEFSAIDTTTMSNNNSKLKELFDNHQFTIELQPEIIYQRPPETE